jgi:hypothetical protein
MAENSIYKNEKGAGKGPSPRPTGKSYWDNFDKIDWGNEKNKIKNHRRSENRNND